MIRIRHWDKFQHYRFRNPPWIRLHRDLLNNHRWHDLDYISRAILVELWLLAADFQDGEITYTTRDISFRLRLPESVLGKHLNCLEDMDFLDIEADDASKVLAGCQQGATTEYRVQSTDTEEIASSSSEEESISCASAPKKANAESATFDLFWMAYPRKKGKKAAFQAYQKACREVPASKILEAVQRAKVHDPQWRKPEYIPHPATWLNQGRWDDELPSAEIVPFRPYDGRPGNPII